MMISCAPKQVIIPPAKKYCTKPPRPAMMSLNETQPKEVSLQNAARNTLSIIEYSKDLEKTIECYEKKNDNSASTNK